MPGRGVTKLGRTHETLVEADQPRLPVVVENQNRLNHLCRPRFSQPCCFQKTPTSATTRALPVGAPLKVAGGNVAPAPWGRPRRGRLPGGGGGCGARRGPAGPGLVATPRLGGSSPRPPWPGREPGPVCFAQTDRSPPWARGRSSSHAGAPAPAAGAPCLSVAAGHHALLSRGAEPEGPASLRPSVRVDSGGGIGVSSRAAPPKRCRGPPCR